MLPRRRVLASVALLVFCGAAPPDEMTSLTEQIVEVMKTIKDTSSAKAAVPKLDALADKVLELRNRLKKSLDEQVFRNGTRCHRWKKRVESGE